nr:hypothetical protein [Kingella negevensis]
MPSSARIWCAWACSAVRLVNVSRDTEAMLAKPSPRKPMLRTCSKSDKSLILLVAWRDKARGKSSA